MYLFFVIIPLIGTIIGASIVFLVSKDMNEYAKKLLVGFAAGVMLAASIWSLLLPSILLSKDHKIGNWFPSSIGFTVGIVFLLIMDKVVLPLVIKKNSNSHKSILMILAVALHNIPEGIAIGVSLSSLLFNNSISSLANVIILVFGITIQNIPEGSVVTTPLISNGMSRKKAFLFGIITGILEPFFSIITILFNNLTLPILPYLLAFAAGAMIYVILVDLIPDSQIGKYSYIGTFGFTSGFVLMMVMSLIFK